MILKFLDAALDELLAHPMSLRRVLAGLSKSGSGPTAAAPPRQPSLPSVAISSVTQWHACRRHLVGSRPRGGYYECENPLAALTHHEVITGFTCDIQDVVGLAASKSDLQRFADLDALAEMSAPDLIREISEAALHRSLGHSGVRIQIGAQIGNRTGADDFFACHAWDGRLFLVNSDGSHHFAAARYIAARLGRAVPMTGALHSYHIQPEAVARLRRDYATYAVPRSDWPAIQDALESYRAPYLSTCLPDPHDHAVVLLPRREARATRVAAVLQKADRSLGMFDLGEHLAALATRQAVHPGIGRRVVVGRPAP